MQRRNRMETDRSMLNIRYYRRMIVFLFVWYLSGHELYSELCVMLHETDRSRQI